MDSNKITGLGRLGGPMNDVTIACSPFANYCKQPLSKGRGNLRAVWAYTRMQPLHKLESAASNVPQIERETQSLAHKIGEPKGCLQRKALVLVKNWVCHCADSIIPFLFFSYKGTKHNSLRHDIPSRPSQRQQPAPLAHPQ